MDINEIMEMMNKYYDTQIDIYASIEKQDIIMLEKDFNMYYGFIKGYGVDGGADYTDINDVKFMGHKCVTKKNN